MSWQTELMKRHQDLFGPPGHQRGYPTVGDGWQLIVEKAIGRMSAAKESARKGSISISQIKGKLGGLRIYADWSGLPDDAAAEVRDAIDLAEARAYCTCETCGAIGRLHDDNGWYATRCDRHAQGEPVERKQGEPDLHIQYRMVDGKMRVTKCRRYDRELDAFVDAPLPPGGTLADED